MSRLDEPGFIPWEDSALLEEESAYAALSKLAWYVATPPANLVRCLADAHAHYEIRFTCQKTISGYPHWVDRLCRDDLMPTVHGLRFDQYVRHVMDAERVEVPPAWQARSLRVCPLCIQIGVHLRLHQHRALIRCPVHHSVLVDVCVKCGGQLAYAISASSRQPAFSCAACSALLLASQQIETQLPPTLVRVAQERVSDLLVWLKPTKAHGLLFLGNRNDELSPSLLWEAIDQCPNRSPRVECASGMGFHQAQLRQIGVIPMPLSAVIRTPDASALIPLIAACSASPREASAETQWVSASAEAVRCAVRRVSTMFLIRAKRHAECRMVPDQMVRLPFGDPFSRLLARCCPVAVGYWLWRQAALTILSSLPSRDVPGHSHQDDDLLQPLLYVCLRSHLHYFLSVAHAFRGDYKRMKLALGRDGEEMLWSAVTTRGEFYEHASGYVTVIRFDASHLIEESECVNVDAAQGTLRDLIGNIADWIEIPRTTGRVPVDERDWHFVPQGLLRDLALHPRWNFRCVTAALRAEQTILDQTINRRGECNASQFGSSPCVTDRPI